MADLSLNGRIRMQVQNISSLRGISSNFGDDTGPDYSVNPALQEANLFQSIAVDGASGAVTAITRTASRKRAALKLTSQDYGGTARLRAELQTDPEFGSVVIPAVDDGDRAAFEARIPEDNDGDGMADSWERLYTAQIGQLRPAEDEEPGYSAASQKGDGFVVHDEYRGFHFIQRDQAAQNAKWASTNPATQKDIFVWDPDNFGFFQYVQMHLAQMLSGLHVFREVNRAQSAPTGLDLSPLARRLVVGREWAKDLASNSTMQAESFGGRALVVLNDMLEEGVLGSTTKRPDGFPVRVDVAQNMRIPANTTAVLPNTLAHEAGHKFGLEHPTRNITPHVALTAPTLLALDRASHATLAQLPQKNLFARLNRNRLEKLAYANAEGEFRVFQREAATPEFASDGLDVYRVSELLDRYQFRTPPSEFYVLAITGAIMDHTESGVQLRTFTDEDKRSLVIWWDTRRPQIIQ